MNSSYLHNQISCFNVFFSDFHRKSVHKVENSAFDSSLDCASLRVIPFIFNDGYNTNLAWGKWSLGMPVNCRLNNLCLKVLSFLWLSFLDPCKFFFFLSFIHVFICNKHCANLANRDTVCAHGTLYSSDTLLRENID